MLADQDQNTFGHLYPVGSSELVAAAMLLATGRTGMATFEVSVRALPSRRSYLVVTGLDRVVDMLEGFRPSPEQLVPLCQSRLGDSLPQQALDWLLQNEFCGDVDAVPEGTVAFAEEPLLRVHAPAPQAHLVGSLITSALGYQTAVSTKMARICKAAQGKRVIELGVSSAAGGPASLLASRAAFIGGASGTSNVYAAAALGIPSIGIISLSVVMRDLSVEQVTQTLLGLPEDVLVELDWQHPSDSLNQLLEWNAVPAALLIDCGDFLETSKQIRKQLDDAGCKDVKLYLAGGLEEDYIENLLNNGAPVDGFGVGGQLVSVADEAYLSLEYNMVEWEADGVMMPVGRQSPGRAVRPGAKMVYRKRERGCFSSDSVLPLTAHPPSGEFPLMVPIMEQGRRLARSPSLGELSALAGSQVQMLDDSITQLANFSDYPVSFEGFQELEASTAPEPEEAPAAPALGGSVLDHLDDSADFTGMSSALEGTVAAQLGLDPSALDEAPAPADPAPQSAATQSAATPAPATAVLEPPPKPEPAAETFTSVDPEPFSGGTVQQVSGGVFDAVAKLKAIQQPSAASSPSPSTLSTTDLASAAAKLKAVSAGLSAAPNATNAAPEGVSKDGESTGSASGGDHSGEKKVDAGGLSDAAARLKSMKKGGTKSGKSGAKGKSKSGSKGKSK